MIQINLLPDVKREYLNSQQTKHVVIIGAVASSVFALAIVTMLFVYVRILQPQHRANLQKDIDKSLRELKSDNNAVKVVTVQGALEQLPALQDKKMMSSYLFNYFNSFTPQGVTYNDVKFDSAAGTLVLTGTTSSYERANTLANNLKSAKFTYTDNDAEQTITPFSSIVFNGLSRQETSQNNQGVGFELALQIDPMLFSQSIKNPKLTVNSSSEQLLLPDAKPFEGGAQ